MTEEQQLRERAARRWRWRLVLPGACGGVAGPLFGDFLFRQQDGNGSPLAAIVGVLVGVGLVVGVVLIVTRRRPRLLEGNGFFSAPLTVGLGWKQRRTAARAARRVRPSSDALLRAAELDLASRYVRYTRRSVVSFAVVVLVCILFAALDNVTTAGRIFFVIGAFLMAGLGIWTVFLTRRAQLYLELVD